MLLPMVLALLGFGVATDVAGVSASQIDDRPSLTAPTNQQSNQLYQGDLRVERGQLVQGDTVVYDGDVIVESDARLTGNLVIFRGNVTIQPDAVVEGNVDLFSGDATIGGIVNGNLALWSGDANLQNSARIAGDVSVLNGRITQAGGAEIGGNTIEGPSLNFGGPWTGAPVESTTSRPFIFLQWLGAFLARLLGAVLLTGFIAVLVGLASHVRPDVVAQVQLRMIRNPATSFLIGLAVNLVLMFLGALLAITICLLPIALVPMLALLAVNLLGWAAISQWVGGHIEEYADRKMDSWVFTAIGAVMLTGVFALLWAFGGPFRFLGGTILLFLASFGAGAVLLPLLNRFIGPRRPGGTPDGPSGDASSAATSTGSTAPATVPTRDAAGQTTGWEPMTDVAQPDVAQPNVAEPVVTEPLVAPTESDSLPATTVEDASGESAAPTAPPESTPSESTPSESAPAAQEPVVTDPGVPGAEADFTELKGIGPVLDGRLKDAGIRTFAQLAALTPAEIAEMVGWTEERVARAEIVEQARAASSG